MLRSLCFSVNDNLREWNMRVFASLPLTAIWVKRNRLFSRKAPESETEERGWVVTGPQRNVGTGQHGIVSALCWVAEEESEEKKDKRKFRDHCSLSCLPALFVQCSFYTMLNKKKNKQKKGSSKTIFNFPEGLLGHQYLEQNRHWFSSIVKLETHAWRNAEISAFQLIFFAQSVKKSHLNPM